MTLNFNQNSSIFSIPDGTKTVQTSGSRGGALKLTLNIEQFDYLPSTRLAGVEVLLQESDLPPLVSSYGVRVPVGRLTNIVMHKIIVSIEIKRVCVDSFMRTLKFHMSRCPRQKWLGLGWELGVSF